MKKKTKLSRTRGSATRWLLLTVLAFLGFAQGARADVWQPTWDFNDTGSHVVYYDQSANCTSNSSGYPLVLENMDNGFQYYMYDGQNSSSNQGNLHVDYVLTDAMTLSQNTRYRLQFDLVTGWTYENLTNSSLSLALVNGTGSDATVLQSIGTVEIDKDNNYEPENQALIFNASTGGTAYLRLTLSGTLEGSYYIEFTNFKAYESSGIPHTVTVNPATGGTVESDKTSAESQETITVTATPDPNYFLSAITVTDETSNIVAQENFTSLTATAWSFCMPDKAVTVSATFDDVNNMPAEYNMPTDGSTLEVTMTAGKTVTIYDDGGEGGGDDEDTPGNYSNNADGYIKLNAPAGYVISLSGTVEVEGSNCDELYIYDGATTEAGVLIGPDNIENGSETALTDVQTTGQTALLRFYSDVNVNYAGFALTATLVDATTPHDITVGSHTNGSLTASPTSATAGTTITVTATPATGYYLSGITVTATEGGATVVQQSFSAQDETEWTFQMPNKAVTVSATFVAEGDYAATITSGGTTTGYYHFADIVDEINNDEIIDGSTLTLLQDVTTDYMHIQAANITLDLNGKTLTATEHGVLTINGNNFTLTDSGTGGTIDATGHDYPLDLYGADATIVGGTVKADDDLVYLNTPTTSCTITGGTFTAISGNKSVYVDNGTLTITGGTYTGMVINDAGNVTISGGTITKANEDDRCAHNDKGTMTISGGKFTGEVYNDTDNNATTTISGGYFSEDPTAGADPAALADGCTLVSESGVVGYPYAVKKSLTLLNDDSGADKTNSQLLAENNGNLRDVTLSGRTLTKDGTWNTLCLPFALTPTQIAASELNGATIKRLDNNALTGSNLDADGTLTLKFIEATSIEAGVPYIVKYGNDGTNTAELVFSGVTITATAPVPVTFANNANSGGNCQFVGQFSNFAIDADNINEIVMLGAGNKLGYSQNPRSLKAFRCHFLIPTAEPAPGAHQQAARRYVIDFGDGESTGIISIIADGSANATAEGVYTLQGIRISESAMQKGSVYIVNGKKMIKK